jgi:hypothetical protein
MKNKLVYFLLFFMCSSSWAASGNVESISTGLINRVDVKVGENSYSAVNFKLVVIINQSSFSLLKSGDVLSANCVGINKNVNGDSIVEGNCLLKDANGDTYATTYERKGTMGNPGTGTQTVKGLTGKFIGMSGSCTYDAKYAQNDGTYVISFANCKYQN